MGSENKEDVHDTSRDLFDEDDEDCFVCSPSQFLSKSNITQTAMEMTGDNSSSRGPFEVNVGNSSASQLSCSITSDEPDSHDPGDVDKPTSNNTELTRSSASDLSDLEDENQEDVSAEYNPNKRHKSLDHRQYDVLNMASSSNKDRSGTITENGTSSVSGDHAEKNSNSCDTHHSVQSSSVDSNTIQASPTYPPNQSVNEERDKCEMSANEQGSDFSCPFCCVRESHVLILEQHIVTAHPDTSEPSIPQFFDSEAAFSMAFQCVCPLCDMDLETESALTTHLSTVHKEEEDSTGSTSASASARLLSCPLCDTSCVSEEEMAHHVKTHESDSTFYGVSASYADTEISPTPSAASQDLVCPMCGKIMSDPDLLTSHVETHFNPHHSPGIETINKENIPVKQTKPVSSTAAIKHKAIGSGQASSSSASSSKGKAGGSPLSRTDSSSYRRQYERSLEQEVVRGRLSVADYHEQRAGMQGNNLKGVDDGHSRVDGLIEQLERFYRQQARPGQRVYLCSPTSHFSGSHGDKGWGCGYRNFQMMLSCLAKHPQYVEKIFKGGRPAIPSVPKVQQMIESAWQKGFDPDGCRQLAGRVVNTQKWIGATEIVATLSSLGVRCLLADFHAPSASDGTHPRLLEWVTDYFTTRQPQQYTPPLYLQHQGHSRTIVGVEIDRGTTRLLLFDPGSKKDHIANLSAGGLSWKCMRTFRRTQAAFKARQYQIVAVDGILTRQEYEGSKIIKSERIS